MKLKTNLVAILLITLFSPSLLAEIPVYGVIINTKNTPHLEAVENGLRAGATSKKADLYLQAPQTKNTEQMIELCNSMLDRKPNVLLIATPDAATFSPCLDKAKKLDIPVVGISHSTDSFQNKHISSVVLTSETDNPHMIGIKAIELASKAINPDTEDGA